MTRFARAKGSKSSNEKAPEDSTPWEVMKEQLLQAQKEGQESKNRQEAERQRIENYENFLKEHKTRKRKATWCDFPETRQETIIPKPVENAKQSTKKKQKQNLDVITATNDYHQEDISALKKNKQNPTKEEDFVNTPQELEIGANKVQKAKKKKRPAATTNEEAIVTKDPIILKNESSVTPLKKNKNKKNKKQLDSATDSSQVVTSEPKVPENDPTANITKAKKKNKNKKNKTSDSIETNTTETQVTQNYDDAKNTNTKKKKKNKKNKNSSAPDQANGINSNAEPNQTEKEKYDNIKQNKIKALKKKKDKKLVDGLPVRRKEINDRSFQLIVSGKEVELVRYDGFPIMKKDALRLEELKTSMIKKGIPKSEVQRTMKLERRRAEKALARMKRDVCYNCRKGGHNLSDCPDLKSKIPGVDAAEGVCFKCGSTEHRQFECKVQRDKEFRFATCFICKEPGHIARQCPDNPKGLYPNGGCCKLCGDVTHLRKDCPTVNDKKEVSTVKLQTLATSDNIEEIGGVPMKSAAPEETSKKPKKIKF